MDLLEAIRLRRTIRKYLKREVPREVIEKLISAATLAPSLRNTQPWLFSVARGKKRDQIINALIKSLSFLDDLLVSSGGEGELRKYFDEKLLKHASLFYSNLGDAPVVIVVSMPTIKDIALRRNAIVGCSSAIHNFILAATEEGLGTCYIASALWVEEEIMNVVGHPEREIVATITLGYPDEKPETPPRRADIVEWLGF